jgi:hypothetical protein
VRASIALPSSQSANSALGLESTITVRSSLSATGLWSKIGDFCGVTAWDPAVERCDLSADGKKRRSCFLVELEAARRLWKIGTIQIAASVGQLMPLLRP